MNNAFLCVALLLVASVGLNLCLWDMYKQERKAKRRLYEQMRKERGWGSSS